MKRSYKPGNDGVRRRQALGQRLLLVALVLRHAVGVAGFPRQEDAAVGLAEIDLSPRRRDEQSPAARAEQHGDRVARAVHVGLPARLHRVELSAAIELHRLLTPRLAFLRQRTAFAHAQHGMLVERERESPVVLEHDLLNQRARVVGDAQRQRVGPDVDRERADLPPHRPRDLAQRERRRRILAIHDGGIDGKLLLEADRLQRDANASLAGGSHVELCGLTGRGDRLRRARAALSVTTSRREREARRCDGRIVSAMSYFNVTCRYTE